MDVEVKGLDSLNKTLDRLAKIDYQKALEESAVQIIKMYKTNILNQNYFGEGWKPWAKSSIGNKRQNGSIISSSSHLLIDTGRLFNSFTFKANIKNLLIKNNMPYASYQDSLRQFMGDSVMVNKLLTEELWKVYKKEWDK